MTSPDTGAQGGAEGGQSADPDNGQTSDAGTDSGAGAQSGAGTGTGDQAAVQPEMVSRADFLRLQAQLSAADKKRTEAEKAFRDLVDKDLPAQEKLTKERDEAAARADKAEADLRQTRLDKAFLTDNKYKWKNSVTALKLADLSKVEVDEDGTVRNLTTALDALAKSDPYLIDADEEKEPAKGSTGAPGTGGRSSDTKTNVNALVSRLPALRTRGIGS